MVVVVVVAAAAVARGWLGMGIPFRHTPLNWKRMWEVEARGCKTCNQPHTPNAVMSPTPEPTRPTRRSTNPIIRHTPH